ncbi:hypothetical protein COL01_11390 [Bacillus thuringiensis]|uniref:hypothetical protein n=1 Tax=Bacillus thuringiensis TaxID=1428 RepID=UPI000BF2BECD|nr:hypothetical protein [Bacillus thuringiensis]PFV34618.1 hypothetical protein COL01_11390 [Bacillus thuringiensis]
MNLEEVLNQTSQSNFISQQDIVYLDGMITKDEDLDYFRLYPFPKNKKMFYKIKKEYIVGEIHLYDEKRILESGLGYKLGFTPNNEFSIYQVPVKFGAEFDFVKVDTAKAGVNYPWEAVAPFAKKKNANPKLCTCNKKEKTLLTLDCIDYSGCPEGCLQESSSQPGKGECSYCCIG